VSFQGVFSASAWHRGDLPSSLHSVWDRARSVAVPRAILKYRVWFIALLQGFLIVSGALTAWVLRFNFNFPNPRHLLSLVSILVAIRLAAITRCGLAHGWWRYTGIDDALALLKATLIGSLFFIFCIRFVLGDADFPRNIYVLEPLVTMLLLGGVRILSRAVAESLQEETTPSRNVILIGAGAGALTTLREIAHRGSGYQAVGCVDDDVSKVGMAILGIPVLGIVDDLPALVKKFAVEEILIAVPSAAPDQMHRFVEVCRMAQVRFKSVPSLRGILNGCLDLAPFQDANLEHLLGREPVEIDLESVRKQIEGQTILVTGAAGSIGSELCRQLLRFNPAKLVCLDRNETAVFYLQMELLAQKAETRIVFCVTDFGDRERAQSVLAEHKPAVIFHAAAYKHVPLMENNVYDAVKNNIFALLQFLEIAQKNDCPTFVLISSDKAVNPTNVMGATKRVGERMISCRPPGRTRCVSVRFGNVLGSNGSVVPVLQKQIRDRRQLTITHPDVTRFFMTTREAVSLVLQAFAIGNHGDTLLLEMGRPLCILDLAKTLIRLSGKSEREIDIRFTGLRPGEKLFEELSYPNEEIHPTASAKIARIHGTPDDWLDLNRLLCELRQSMSTGSDAAIRDKVKEIVPEYAPKEGKGIGFASASMNPQTGTATPEDSGAFVAVR